ncbi:MAG: hypothetical protein IJX34_02560 [Clostridia bacterium]|nr:hypothetical protein [Clostridia bacterium]
MEKFINCIKKNKFRILIAIFFLFLFLGTTDISFAKINSNSEELVSVNNGNWFTDAAGAIVDKILQAVGSITAGTIMKLLSVVVLAIAGVGFLLLYSIWITLGGSIFDLPFPDKIVFNKMILFDPNFINRTTNSELISAAKDMNIMEFLYEAASSLYFTFFIVAGLIMVVAAMVIGIKLAISSIAAEKAQYKETLNKWIVGIVILFSLHFLILGAFTLNEQICEIASEIADDCVFTFDFTDLNIVTKAAGAIKGFFTGFASWISGDGWDSEDRLEMPLEGYSGIIFYLIFNVVLNGDLICSLAFLALIGQTINLIVQYLKRFIFVIFLAIISPLVVAVDVVKRAL